MNQKGVLLTLMVFFVGIVVVALAINNASQQKERESLLPQDTAQYAVNERFDQAYYTISNFRQNQGIASSRNRVLPFRYEIDGNKLFLHQTMPIVNTRFNELNDFINLFSIFWNAKNDLNSNFSFDSIRNQAWGGEEPWPIYDFKLLPSCILYHLDREDNNNGKRVMILKKGSLETDQCDFDRQWTILSGQPTSPVDHLRNFYPIQKIIVNIYSDRNITNGSLSCTNPKNQFNDWGGTPNSCVRKPFDANRGWPYGELNFFVGKDLNFSVYNHFDPEHQPEGQGQEQRINFQIDQGSQSATFGGDEILVIDLSGIDSTAIVTADVNIIFRKPIEAFLLENFSLMVENPPFGIRKLSMNENQLGYCGDGNCDAPDENFRNCAFDCTCGNRKCEAWENPTTCYCAPGTFCGFPNQGDCKPFHSKWGSDKICSDGEYASGQNDCGCSTTSGNYAPTCDPNENFTTCPQDCAWNCGNVRCDSGENSTNCPYDCIPCTDECPYAGFKECVDEQSTHVCGNYDSDHCLEWGPITACPPGYVCSNGVCTLQTGGATGG